MNRVLLLCLFGIVSSNFINNVVARLSGEGIIGGEEADENQFPYQVALQINGRAACGGGIIADKYILTAAHCFIKADRSFYNLPYRVVAGTTNLNLDGGIHIAAEKVYVHKDYQPPNTKNDIAILKLKEGLGIDSKPSLAKLNLPKAKSEYTNRTAVIAGYGYTNIQVMTYPPFNIKAEVGGSSDNKLHFAEVDIISNTECIEKSKPRPVYDSHICGHVKQRSLPKTAGVCSGDSGGPLVIDNNVVIGIVSTSPVGCDESEQAASYTRVSSHLSFIEKVLKDQSTTGLRVFKVPDGEKKPTEAPGKWFLPFFPLFSSDREEKNLFSAPQYGEQYPQFPSFSLPFEPLTYRKRK